MISKDKRYKTKYGREVKIYEVYENEVHGAYKTGKWNMAHWNINGSFQNDGSDSCNDLIEISPYDDFKIDDKVLVWMNNSICESTGNKNRGYFAGVNKEGRALIFDYGAASFTAESTTDWDNCEKYEENND